jgi:hypothetical protein
MYMYLYIHTHYVYIYIYIHIHTFSDIAARRASPDLPAKMVQTGKPGLRDLPVQVCSPARNPVFVLLYTLVYLCTWCMHAFEKTDVSVSVFTHACLCLCTQDFINTPHMYVDKSRIYIHIYTFRFMLEIFLPMIHVCVISALSLLHAFTYMHTVVLIYLGVCIYIFT